jgi:hypothetical protein
LQDPAGWEHFWLPFASNCFIPADLYNDKYIDNFITSHQYDLRIVRPTSLQNPAGYDYPFSVSLAEGQSISATTRYSVSSYRRDVQFHVKPVGANATVNLYVPLAKNLWNRSCLVGARGLELFDTYTVTNGTHGTYIPTLYSPYWMVEVVPAAGLTLDLWVDLKPMR